ncbi:MAG: hypothetical protein E6356_14045 [Terrisporobacter othiniensis]|nr:hypothetical protein [Terrisporobacter othiniensis]
MSAKVIINLFDEEDKLLNGLSELTSDELCICYSNINYYGHGIQSNYEEPDEKYYKQIRLCNEIIKLAKELKDISK